MPISMTQERRVISSLAWRRAEWIAAAASVLLVVSIGLLAAMMRDRQTVHEALQAELARNAGTETSNDSLRALVASRDSMISGLIGRDVAVMSLTSAGAKAPFARMFWDTTRNTWTLAAHNMPELRSGRTYQLWLVTKTAKISAGTFSPTNGEAVVRATYPLARDSLEAIAVTEEPAGGMPQPTGAIVIAGK
jgi:anti-sigma-K factor RskA